jgi:hypothetical protein
MGAVDAALRRGRYDLRSLHERDVWLALGYGLAGTFMFLLIITIPFGFASFRLAPLCSGRSAARL